MELFGFHGTDNSSAVEIIRQQNIKPSVGLDEWLGRGRYFFVCPQDALWWCKNRNYLNPKVIKAQFEFKNKVIDLVANVEDQRKFYEYCELVKRKSENLPNNKKRRNYMQLAIEKLLSDAKARNIVIDAAKASFNENRSFWHFKKDDAWKFPCIIGQIQLCVYNQNAIVSLELYEEAILV